MAEGTCIICIIKLFVYIYLFVYVSYSWSNGWTELAEIF